MHIHFCHEELYAILTALGFAPVVIAGIRTWFNKITKG